MKLPKLSLPHFSGNVTKWTTFWDLFESAVHNNDDLTDVDKFNYLRSLLERTAYEAISGLTLSSANHREAIDVLHKWFGNKQLIISKHMETLLGIEAVTSEQDVKGLRRLHDDVESHIQGLKSLGVAPELYGALLSPVLLNKLPPELRFIISRKVTDSTLDVDSLLKTVEDELIAREQPTIQRKCPLVKTKTNFALPLLHFFLPHNLPLLVRPAAIFSSPIPQPIAPQCPRKQILRMSGRCFNCLGKGHLGRHCRSSRKCLKCNGRHHSSICEGCSLEQTPLTVEQQSLAQHVNVLTPSLNPGTPPFTATPTLSNLCTNGKKAVLLQTTRASIYNPTRPQRSIEV